MDPSVYVISQDGELNIGDMVKVRIVDCSDEYDMTELQYEPTKQTFYPQNNSCSCYNAVYDPDKYIRL